MVNYSPSAKISTIAAILSMILLLAIFILPTVIINEIAEKVLPKTRDTIKEIFQKDWDRAVSDIDFVANTLDKNEKTLMLFVDHQLIDELISAAQGSQHLVRMHDDGQVFVELEFIINRMHYLTEIESFTIGNLL